MAMERKRLASAVEDRNSKMTPTAGGSHNSTDAGADPKEAINTRDNEITFGKHLASSNKRVRDRTVTALREWLQQRSRGGALTDLDLLKIWRGLWYCMFMCDKAPIQRELAVNLAGLLALFKGERSEGVRFFKSFCITMQRDWEVIDNLRIDKYYTLVRIFVREALAFCRVPADKASDGPPTKKKMKRKNKKGSPSEDEESAPTHMEADDGASTAQVWDLGLLGAMSDVMEEEVLTFHPGPIGLRLHLADVWAEEACNAGGEDMPTEAFLVALAPWLRVAAHPGTNAVVFRRTFEGIFEGLLEYFPERDGGDDPMDQEEEGEKKVFRMVELDQVQACLFEVAAAPQTREKRRTQMYAIHRRYQKRTGIAPDANAPLSGILPLPEDSESDGSDDEEGDGYDGEYVEAGSRPRAVRGPEPAVPGWVAAGIAAGAIREEEEEGETEGGQKKSNKRKKGGDSLESQEGGSTGEAEGESWEVGEKQRQKKRKSAGVEEEGGGDAEGGLGDNVRRKKKKRRGSVEKKGEGEAAPSVAVAASTAGAESVAAAESTTAEEEGSRKQKKSEILHEDETSGGGGGGGAAGGEKEPLPSPPSSSKRKGKKKRRGSPNGAAGAATAAAVAVAPPPETNASSSTTTPAATSTVPEVVSTLPTSGKKKKKKAKKKSGEDRETEGGSPDTGGSEEAREVAKSPEQQPTSGKKKKKKRSSPGGDTSSASPENATSPGDSTPPPAFLTPPKKGNTKGGNSLGKLKSPKSLESARKTVTFGTNTEKEHVASVKDLKTRIITPAKDAGTPQNGLLKVGGGGSGMKAMKPAAGRKDTPYISKKKASDFF